MAIQTTLAHKHIPELDSLFELRDSAEKLVAMQAASAPGVDMYRDSEGRVRYTGQKVQVFEQILANIGSSLENVFKSGELLLTASNDAYLRHIHHWTSSINASMAQAHQGGNAYNKEVVQGLDDHVNRAINANAGLGQAMSVRDDSKNVNGSGSKTKSNARGSAMAVMTNMDHLKKTAFRIDEVL